MSRVVISNGVCSQLIGRAKRAPHWGVQSRFRVIYIYRGMSVVCQINCVGGITWPTRMLKVILCAVKTDL